MIQVKKSALEEPEIRTKRGRISKHRKGFVNVRVPHCPDIEAHLRDGGITIDEACGVDALVPDSADADVPVCANALLFRVFFHYMMNGELPDCEMFTPS